ncbi:MAG: DsrE family protein [Elusimicrobia bacterium]|nr:DsrE family protein [Elusimicrobiota bacterium]
MRALTMAALLLAAIPAAAKGFAGAVPTKKHYGVIFQLDSESPQAMKKTLANVRNVLEDPRLTGRVEVELLANSGGYNIYKKGNGLEGALKELAAKGVILAQCRNTLRELKVDPSTLYPFIHIVPSAMGELVIREGQGWAYIHP